MGKRVIFSDLHFGHSLCAFNEKLIMRGLRSFLRTLGDVQELILAGDILDLNVSTMAEAIGRNRRSKFPKQPGIRKWLDYLLENDHVAVERIVYIPGNHDYIIWHILSTDKAYIQPISEGKDPRDFPLMEDTFPSPFIRGVAPEGIKNKFEVAYPDHTFTLADRSVLVTHGHYLDEKQTLFRNLKKLIRKENGNKEKAVRDFFMGTAQLQLVVYAMSYMKNTRSFIELVHKTLGLFYNYHGKLRGKHIDAGILKAIEMYLLYFRNEKPDVFIFGHTHEAGHTKTSAFSRGSKDRLIKKEIDVWNTGSFIKSRERAGTFIVVDDKAKYGELIKLFQVNHDGKVSAY